MLPEVLELHLERLKRLGGDSGTPSRKQLEASPLAHLRVMLGTAGTSPGGSDGTPTCMWYLHEIPPCGLVWARC